MNPNSNVPVHVEAAPGIDPRAPEVYGAVETLVHYCRDAAKIFSSGADTRAGTIIFGHDTGLTVNDKPLWACCVLVMRRNGAIRHVQVCLAHEEQTVKKVCAGWQEDLEQQTGGKTL
jgi:hypothetical protein